MKRSFAILEFTFVIIVFTLITTFLLYNFTNFFNLININKWKFQINQIRSNIIKKNNDNIIKGLNRLSTLDNSLINQENSKLFSYILKEPIISSKNSWMKYGYNKYILNLKDQKIKFEYKNSNFICISQFFLCKGYQ